jgi:MinD-like ATPase involved in chromosome partitioning or flagellar assembly
MSAPAASSDGQIVTFHAYSAGIGRSLALVNVSWTLASLGKRVLVVDGDLNSPGLHHYFAPFLEDPGLGSTEGVLDAAIDFATAFVTTSSELDSALIERGDVLRYAVSLDWVFPDGGKLDLLGAGRHGKTYELRAAGFDWAHFLEALAGRTFFDELSRSMRASYDYILIDAPAGTSPLGSVCTVQLPDAVVLCYTLASSSIQSAAQGAEALLAERGARTIRVLPATLRVDLAEKGLLDRARSLARSQLEPFLRHLPSAEERANYFGEVEMPYVPFYAYAAIPAAFVDTPEQTSSLLSSAERLTWQITGSKLGTPVYPSAPDQKRIVARYRELVPDEMARQPP